MGKSNKIDKKRHREGDESLFQNNHKSRGCHVEVESNNDDNNDGGGLQISAKKEQNGSVASSLKTKSPKISSNVDATTTSSAVSAVASVASVSVGSILLKAGPNDILLGRGKPFQSYSGNQAMRRLVNENKVRYNQLPRDKRGVVTNEILQSLEKSGARFLKRPKQKDDGSGLGRVSVAAAVGNVISLSEDVNQGGWEIVSMEEAYEKVCHALRAKGKSKDGNNGNENFGEETIGCSEEKMDSSVVASSLSFQEVSQLEGRMDDEVVESGRISSELGDLAIQMALDEYLGRNGDCRKF